MDFAKGEEGMERLIVQIGIMSVQAAIVICVILLVRLFFARLHVPKKYVMLLWIIPYFLMVCPWKIESSFSFWQVMESRQMDSVQKVVQHVQYELEQKGEEICKADLAASFQRAVVEALVEHTMAAAREKNCKIVTLAGGVSANGALRAAFDEAAGQNGLTLYYPPLILCTDNAAMIGCAGYYLYKKGVFADSALNAVPNLKL